MTCLLLPSSQPHPTHLMTESSLGHLGRAGKGIEAWGHLIRAVSSLLSNPPFAETIRDPTMGTFETTQPLPPWPGHVFSHVFTSIARPILFWLFKNKILLHSSG